MKTELFHINFNEHKLTLLLDNQKPIIFYCGVYYNSLNDFFLAFPSLIENKELKTLAQITNFFFGGLQYSLIEDIENYQKKYRERIEKEKTATTDPTLSQYGQFEISKLKTPELIENTLYYFVESMHFGIPYQVQCKLPNQNFAGECSYSLLPHITPEKNQPRTN